MHHLAPGRKHEEGVEEAVGHHLGPARFALGHDVGVVVARQLRQPLGLRAGDVDEQLTRRNHVRDVEDLVGEPRQRALGEGDQLDRQVDADDRDGSVDRVLDDVQVPLDVRTLPDAVHDRGEAHRHVRSDRL